MPRIKTTLVLAVRYLFLTRYSWLMALVLVALVPMSLGLLPRLLANLFVLDSPEQIFHVSWISMWCAATVMETLRVTTMNAHLRFDDYRIATERFREAWGIEAVDDTVEWYRNRVGWVMMLLGLAAAVGVWHGIMSACIECTAGDPAAAWNAYVDAADEAAMRAFCWQRAAAGLAATLTLLGLINGLMILSHERRTRRGDRGQPRWQRSLYAFLNTVLGPGYLRAEPDSAALRLAPGHLRLGLYTTTFLVWYAVNYVTATGDRPMPTEASSYTALFYALLSLLLLLYLLTGCAFFCDRYRIPVPLLMLGAMLVFFSAFGTDHYYELNLAHEEVSARDGARDLTEVFDEWEFPAGPDGQRTLVVVDASGGGIQASAWTAQVLTGLHEVYGNEFSQSIGLISSVSGGSVGTMFYLANRAEMAESLDPALASDDALTPEAIARIREAARSSALEATAWGLAYPDSLRTVFPFAVDKTIDRGWAIEQVWQQRMKPTAADPLDRGNLTLADLGDAIRRNQLPVPVFNATLMESGQRLQISPVLGPPRAFSGSEGENDTNAPDRAVQLLEEFPHARPLVATAARLSATFPYVTPAARASIPAELESEICGRSALARYHVVDGAYVDNEGAVTSVDWINRLLTHYAGRRNDERPFDRVLLLRIQAFPVDVGQASGKLAGSASGWRSALIGPLDAMMTVRSASQTERGDLEVGLLSNMTRARTETKAREAALKKAMAVADVVGDAAGLGDGEPQQNADANLSAADIARMQAMSRDNAERVSAITQTVEQQVQDEVRAATEVEVYSVMIDFHSPNKAIRIPMSWKLTAKQKQNVEEAWESLVRGEHPQRPLELLDEFFERASTQRQGSIAADDGHQSAPTL